ncbi:MAG: xanthine dehydrogenase family protein subunit M [Clostridia bacterium]|nr:xanthine dehydrogenase family protein subunit M [Clostridia bacterium]
MTQFSLYRPSSLDDALSFLSSHPREVKPIAGGTDLLVAARQEAPNWTWALDLSGLGEIRGIRRDGMSVCIGAGTTHAEISESTLIAETAPFLASAVRTIGSAQIRNRATIGGNIMNASPAADSIPPLVALDAVAAIGSVRGVRTVELGELITGPYSTAVAFDELLLDVRFRPIPPGARSEFIKLGRRRAMAISRLSVAAMLAVDDNGLIMDARVSAGAAFPTPCRIREAEAVLGGRQYRPELAAEAGKAAGDAMVRASGIRWSTDYKLPVLGALVARAIRRCAGEESWE